MATIAFAFISHEIDITTSVVTKAITSGRFSAIGKQQIINTLLFLQPEVHITLILHTTESGRLQIH